MKVIIGLAIGFILGIFFWAIILGMLSHSRGNIDETQDEHE